MEITVSIAQMDVVQGEPGTNLERGCAMIAEAAQRGSHLICFPEMWTTGFDWERNRKLAAAHATIQRAIAEQAARHGVWISSPMLSLSTDGRMQNTSFLFAPDGSLPAAYNKIHLFSPIHEDRSIHAGNTLCVADTPWGLTGLSICYDLRFPELFRSLALRGVCLQICSAAFPHPRQEHWRVLTRARAIENQVFMLAVNRVGSETVASHGSIAYCGASAVIDPWGNSVVEAEEQECLLTTAIDTALCNEARTRIPVLHDRRPDAYEL
jgi:predicted amidohydrolase